MVSDRQSAEYVIPTELKSFGLIAVLTLTVLGIVYLLQFRDVDGAKEVDSGSGKPENPRNHENPWRDGPNLR